MKNLLLSSMFALMMIFTFVSTIEAGTLGSKPEKPEKIIEDIPDQPSPYHFWVEGRWKYKRKAEEWLWKPGYWKMDNDYLYRPRSRFFSPYAFANYYYLGNGLYAVSPRRSYRSFRYCN